MICAYCKSRLFETDRKCPACGSTVFIAEEPIKARRAASQEDTSYAAGGREAFRQPEVRYETVYQTVYAKPERSGRSRWLALLLCALGGVIGLHRFYAGKIGTGLLFLFTGGFFGVGVAVDFIVILCGYFRDRKGLLLHS